MCVPPGAKFEFEIDTMDIESNGANSTTTTRYGLVVLDKFAKIANVIPIEK